MAEGSGSRHPRRGMGYYGPSYAPPLVPYSPLPVATYQAPHQEMFISSFQRGMQYTQYQDNASYVGNPHFSSGTNYEASTPYHGSNQYQGNVPFQDRTNMQYQSNCMMPSNPTTHMPFDNNFSNFNANHTPLSPSTEYGSEGSRQCSPRQQSARHGFGVDLSMNYHNVNPENQRSPTEEVNGASGNSPVKERVGNTCVEKSIEKFPSSPPNYHVSNAFERDSSTLVNANENSAHGFSGGKVAFGNLSEGSVKSKGFSRGRGGQGRRGGRRSYGGEKSGQGYINTLNSSNTYGRYDSQANSADEKRRDRDTALAETAAFMKNLSVRKGGNVNSREDNAINERRSRGGWGRQDRGGSRGGGSRRQQRDYYGEEKQGKEWMNRQMRTEDELGHSEAHNRFPEQNDIHDKPQRNDKFSNRGRRSWQNGSQDGVRTLENTERSWETSKNHDQDVSKAVTIGQMNVKPFRGGGRRRQDRQLWGNSDSSSSPSSDPGSRNAKKENKSMKEGSLASSSSTVIGGNEDEETQRDRLMEQLMKGTYECMVCCDRIKQQHAIWSCVNCYNCFHLGCIKKWAKSSTGDAGWRCPACQGSTPKVPNAYRCFCGKMREPEWNRRDMAHSCGEICGRNRKIEWCKHKCNILCHPGPCPPCTAFIKRSCPCGAETREVKCSVTEPFVCNGVCGKLLNCEGHKCKKYCHTGPCGDCQHQVQQRCHCGKKNREVACIRDTYDVAEYGCGDKCCHTLECGNHQCEAECHPGDCQPCERAIDTITRCPCSKVPLEKLYERDGAIQRKSCADPIPTCSQPCQRVLKCGVPGSYHECQALCHEGPCPPCPLETPVKCRCGAVDRNVLCSELTTKADEVTCKKPCKKMRHCGRHRCSTRCCIDVDHLCTLVCGRMLSCGLHKCEEPCHRGNCPRCWQTSFEELTCHCGASVIYPPVPCGTKPPVCENPCRRPQNCPHEATHLCHPDETCPPCTMLVDKPCFGNHKIMLRTLCYLTAVSCGGVCGLPLPCGLHKCQRVCHEQPCVPEGILCTQKCLKPRESCGHPCANPCHSGLCPDTSCKEMVKISCKCGHRKATLQCSENDREYRTFATSLLASQMQNMNNGCSVDLSDIFTATARSDKLKRLPCNEECQTAERNRRLALALQIENPEAREKLGNSSVLYSDFMKNEARKDPNLAKMVHDKLTELVMKAKEQKSCIHSFAPMNRVKRQFVHEYCEHFGCQSESYDEEPKKNVVATAVRGMCYLPPVSVLTLILREQGKRKVPAPVWTLKPTMSDTRQGMQKLEKSSSTKKESDSTASKPPPIDYFDFDE